MMNMIEASKGLFLVVIIGTMGVKAGQIFCFAVKGQWRVAVEEFKWMASGGAIFAGVSVVVSMMLSQL